LDEIAKAIECNNPQLASDFREAPAPGEALTIKESEKQRSAHVKALLPVRDKIDQYVLRFDDTKLRNYGGSCRSWMRRFIEQHFLEYGKLPHGVLRVEVKGPMSYSGGDYDFRDLK
jgi:hypothetical protein